MTMKFRYLIQIEWDPKPNCDEDFDIWVNNDLNYLIERVLKARKKGFDTAIGSCPNLYIVMIKDTLKNKYFSKQQIKQKIKEINNASTI